MIYTYKCKACNKEFEIIASFFTIQTMEKFCPNCKSHDIIRKFFPTNFILVGDGFYKNDSKNKK
jgi:putative FmdB family regulatory protein